jgi:hypothetical protein
MKELIKLLDSGKNFKKTERAFLEALYNSNGRLRTRKHWDIENGFKYKSQLNLMVKRIDYSNDYIITTL